MIQDVKTEAAKAVPPLAVSVAASIGFSLNDMVLAATLIYILMQAGYLGLKWYREYKTIGRRKPRG